jgi:eukaryotic-like serine/threonine-protein kinase
MEKDRLISESSESARPDLPTAPNESLRPPHPELPQRMLATAVTDAQSILGDAPSPGPADNSNLPEPKPPPVLGDFRLAQKLGEGAMGSVYRAEQVSTPGIVALKVLFPHMARNPKFVERFYREALSMGRLDHPNIVRGFAVGEDQGWHYFAMEFVDGRSLQKWLTLLGKLSVGDAVHIALACADALGHAHDHDLVHRDVKPDNIMITRKGVVKVTDLGAVKVLTEDLTMTQTGHGIGTPCYMPLEQARNAKDTDGRSDIYALGCVLYCMLTGRPPFSGETLVDLIQAKDIAKFPPARRFNPEVPERLDLIIDKMVAKVLRYRYQNCADVIRDLQALGIANRALSFIPAPGAKQGPYGRVPEEPTPRPAIAKPAPALAESAIPSEWWYVTYEAPTGTVTRKLTSSQIVKMIETEALGPSSLASRTAEGGYRALASCREFESILFSRATKAGLDQKTSRYRDLYKKIDEEDLERQRENLAASIIPDWPLFLYKLAAIGIAGGIIYFLSQWLLRWLMSGPPGPGV